MLPAPALGPNHCPCTQGRPARRRLRRRLRPKWYSESNWADHACSRWDVEWWRWPHNLCRADGSWLGGRLRWKCDDSAPPCCSAGRGRCDRTCDPLRARTGRRHRRLRRCRSYSSAGAEDWCYWLLLGSRCRTTAQR